MSGYGMVLRLMKYNNKKILFLLLLLILIIIVYLVYDLFNHYISRDNSTSNEQSTEIDEKKVYFNHYVYSLSQQVAYGIINDNNYETLHFYDIDGLYWDAYINIIENNNKLFDDYDLLEKKLKTTNNKISNKKIINYNDYKAVTFEENSINGRINLLAYVPLDANYVYQVTIFDSSKKANYDVLNNVLEILTTGIEVGNDSE